MQYFGQFLSIPTTVLTTNTFPKFQISIGQAIKKKTRGSNQLVSLCFDILVLPGFIYPLLKGSLFYTKYQVAANIIKNTGIRKLLGLCLYKSKEKKIEISFSRLRSSKIYVRSRTALINIEREYSTRICQENRDEIIQIFGKK